MTLPPADDANPLTAALRDVLVRAVATALELPEETVRARCGEPLGAALRAHLDEAHARLDRAERLAVAGRLAATVAHELRNPLSVIETSAFVLAEHARGDERVARHTRRISEQVALAGGVVGDLLESTRDRPPQLEATDLGDLLHAATSQVPWPPAARLVLEVPAGLPIVRLDPRRIRQVLTNLLLNALEATAGRGRIVVGAELRADAVAVRVCDDGPGIAKEHAARLFDPLFTTKPDGTGLGLGLSREIVRRHGGELRVAERDGPGACFEFTLPLSAGGAR